MAQIAVPEGTDTAITSSANGIVQNLGPGVLYVDTGSVDEGTGVRVEVGQAISLTSNTQLHGIASGSDCDVRVIQLASGIHGR